MDETTNKQDEQLVLRTEGLVKVYGKRTVVNDVSFNVRQGEIVGLLGPNGAGKTTSFYMTTGLVVPNGGHVYLGEEEVTTYPVYRRARAGIGYLAQENSVFRKMSVEDNISWRVSSVSSVLTRFVRTRATSCPVVSVVALR